MPENEQISKILSEAARRKAQEIKTKQYEEQARSKSTKAKYDEAVGTFAGLDTEHRQTSEAMLQEQETLEQIAKAKVLPEIDEAALTELAKLETETHAVRKEKKTKLSQLEAGLAENSQLVKGLVTTPEGHAIMADVQAEAQIADDKWNAETEKDLKRNPYEYMETKQQVVNEFQTYAEQLHRRVQSIENIWKNYGVKWFSLARPNSATEYLGAPWQLQQEIASCQEAIDGINHNLRRLKGFHPIQKSRLNKDLKEWGEKKNTIEEAIPEAMKKMREAEQELLKKLAEIKNDAYTALPKFETALKAPVFFRKIKARVETRAEMKFGQVESPIIPDSNNPTQTKEEIRGYLRGLENLSKEIKSTLSDFYDEIYKQT